MGRRPAEECRSSQYEIEVRLRNAPIKRPKMRHLKSISSRSDFLQEKWWWIYSIISAQTSQVHFSKREQTVEAPADCRKVDIEVWWGLSNRAPSEVAPVIRAGQDHAFGAWLLPPLQFKLWFRHHEQEAMQPDAQESPAGWCDWSLRARRCRIQQEFEQLQEVLEIEKELAIVAESQWTSQPWDCWQETEFNAQIQSINLQKPKQSPNASHEESQWSKYWNRWRNRSLRGIHGRQENRQTVHTSKE